MAQRIEIHRSREEAQDQFITTGSGCCSGGEEDFSQLPELEIDMIPQGLRQAAVFGAIEALPRSGALILSATEKTLPLLEEVAQRCQEIREVRFIEEGPERWHLLVRR